MSDENRYITVEELDEILNAVINQLSEQFSMLENRVNLVEQLHAKLAIAYAELGSSVETIIQEMMSPRSEEEKKEFRDAMNSQFMNTLEVIQKVTNESARQNTESALDDALASLAEQRKDSTTNE